MKLVAGLGNVPESRYRGTRHNVGFRVLDILAARHGVHFEPAPMRALQGRWRHEVDLIWLLKPTTLMNLSGEAVGEACRYYKVALTDLLIVCDDVNLPLGRLRGRVSGSEGGHNGLRSVAEHLGTTDYARLRVGVGRGDDRWDLADHVLAGFEPAEQPVIAEAAERAADAVETWVCDGLVTMMNRFNREPDAPAEGGTT